MRGFASDNNAGVHPEILKALSEVNTGHTVGYGDDKYTAIARDKFKEVFGEDVEFYPVYNGTGANVVSIQTLIRPFNAVICTDVSHIYVDECGAPEKHSGAKLLPVKTKDGKLTMDLIKQHMHGFGFEHHSQPKMVSITQVSELGTVYTIDEIKAIADYVHSHDMYLHMDGARISNAAVSLGCTLKEMTFDAGVDVLSYGGTKNGMMFGEAVVFANAKLAENVKYIRKQSTQLHSKMRYTSAQFTALLSNELWKRNAEHSNKMAAKLAEKIAEIPQVKITQKVQANGVFCIVPPELIEPLQKEFFFYMWDESRNEVRWMTSFDTTEEDIDNFVKTIKKLLN
ncbi:MAG: low specificity L-threonine aldolase [Chlorobi bacterium]|nr:low specificity L-threonine aldolase [Chlorobiota bacterium]